MKENQHSRITLRIPIGLKVFIHEESENNQRSLNSQIIHMLDLVKNNVKHSEVQNELK